MQRRMIKPHIEHFDLVELAKKIPKPKETQPQPEDKQGQEGQSKIIQLPTTDIRSPESYILLEGTQDYPDILVQQYRLPLHQEVEQALKSINIYDSLIQRAGKDETGSQKPLNPQKDNSGINYLGYLQHQEALDLTNYLGGFPLPLPQWRDFLKSLRSGKAYDGTGSLVPKSKLDQILDEILTQRSPWRSEYLDAKFLEQGDKFYITYHKINPDGTLTKATEALAPDTLMEDKIPGISLDSWLNNAASQSLPIKNTPQGDLWYWHPRNNGVARFVAYSSRVGLYCYGDPRDSSASLGVRFARLRASP